MTSDWFPSILRRITIFLVSPSILFATLCWLLGLERGVQVWIGVSVAIGVPCLAWEWWAVGRDRRNP